MWSQATKAAKESKAGIFDFDDCYLSDEGANALADVTSRHPLPFNFHSDADSESLCLALQALATNKSVTEIILSDNNITGEGAKSLALLVSILGVSSPPNTTLCGSLKKGRLPYAWTSHITR